MRILNGFTSILIGITVISCSNHTYYVTKIEGSKTTITEAQTTNTQIEQFVKPYREHIDADLNIVLAYSPETLDKAKGKWQTNIGNFLADVSIEKSNSVFEKRYTHSIDFCLLNNGGIRTIIPKGNITARNAYEVMPFENAAVVVALKTEQVIELCNYIITEKKPHPISGIAFTIGKDNLAKNIKVKNNDITANKIYYVLTSDYLSNGGDNMVFFKKGIEKFDLDYKLRNILIDYFKEVDTLKINNDTRITEE